MPVNGDGSWVPDLIPKGYEIFNSYKRCLLIDGPRRSGKSISADNKVCRHLWEVEHAKVGIIARTLKQGKTGVWDDLTGWVVQQWIEANMGFRYTMEPKMEADTKMSSFKVRNFHGGESVCQLHSLEHDQDVETKFKDSRFSLIYLVEADKFKERAVFTTLKSQLRALGVPFESHQIICDCNPPEEGEDHFLHDIFIKKLGNNKREDGPDPEFYDYFARIQVLLEDNTKLTPAEMHEQKEQYKYDPDLYARWTEGKWIKYSTAGHFKDIYFPNIHVKGNASSYNKDDWELLVPTENCIELFTGWDLGDVNHAAGIASKRELPDGTAFDLIDELVILDRRVSIDDFTEAFLERMDFWENFLLERYGRKNIRWRHWSDESAFKYKAAADSYDELIVRNASGGRIVLSGCPKGRNSVRQRISLFKKLLFQNRIAISAQLKYTQDMCRNLKPGTRQGEPIDIDAHATEKHVFDFWTYMLASESPMDLERRIRPVTTRNIVAIPA